VEHSNSLASLAVLQTPPMFRPIPSNARQARRENGVQFNVPNLRFSFSDSAIRYFGPWNVRNSKLFTSLNNGGISF
jgi:hypothetical protein